MGAKEVMAGTLIVPYIGDTECFTVWTFYSHFANTILSVTNVGHNQCSSHHLLSLQAITRMYTPLVSFVGFSCLVSSPDFLPCFTIHVCSDSCPALHIRCSFSLLSFIIVGFKPNIVSFYIRPPC